MANVSTIAIMFCDSIPILGIAPQNKWLYVSSGGRAIATNPTDSTRVQRWVRGAATNTTNTSVVTTHCQTTHWCEVAAQPTEKQRRK